MRTLIIGLGNPFLTDDGVGVLVANQVQDQLREKFDNNVTIIEASVGGLRLMETMEGYDEVILIDAIIREKGNQPGKIQRMTLEDLQHISPTQHSASAHDTSLITALKAGELMGLRLPKEIVIFAIEVENVMDFSEVPTPAVQKAIPLVTQAVLEELNKIYM